MHFYDRYFDRCQGVAQGDRVMSERPGVDNEAIRIRCMLLDIVYQSAFVIRLEALYSCRQSFPALAQAFIDLFQRHRAINSRFTSPQSIQIWPVQNQDSEHLLRSLFRKKVCDDALYQLIGQRRDDHLSDATRHNPAHALANNLFIQLNLRQDIRCAHRSTIDDGQPQGGEQLILPRGLLRREHARLPRQTSRRRHAQRDSFAVQPFAIARHILQGMADSMAVVQNSAAPLLALILLYHHRFQVDAARDDLAEQGGGRRRKVAQSVRMGFQQGKQFSVKYDTILYDFCPSLGTFALRQGQQRRRVGKDEARMIESSDQIFAPYMINTSLAANSGIDLGQQGCRYLDQWDASQICSGGIAHQIAHDASAKRDDRFAALGPALYQPIVDGSQLLLRFALFSGGHNVEVRLKAGLREILQYLWRV